MGTRNFKVLENHLIFLMVDFLTHLWTLWCAPRQVDSEIIYILRMKILPAYHMVLGAMQPVDGHGLP